MIREGQIVLFRFPLTDQSPGKLRPALILRRSPGGYNDWLISMISSQTNQYIPNFDEMIDDNSPDFRSSGLKKPSVIRIGRLAVVEQSIFFGAIGSIDDARLSSIRVRLSDWITNGIK